MTSSPHSDASPLDLITGIMLRNEDLAALRTSGAIGYAESDGIHAPAFAHAIRRLSELSFPNRGDKEMRMIAETGFAGSIRRRLLECITAAIGFVSDGGSDDPAFRRELLGITDSAMRGADLHPEDITDDMVIDIIDHAFFVRPVELMWDCVSPHAPVHSGDGNRYPQTAAFALRMAADTGESPAECMADGFALSMRSCSGSWRDALEVVGDGRSGWMFPGDPIHFPKGSGAAVIRGMDMDPIDVPADRWGRMAETATSGITDDAIPYHLIANESMKRVLRPCMSDDADSDGIAYAVAFCREAVAMDDVLSEHIAACAFAGMSAYAAAIDPDALRPALIDLRTSPPDFEAERIMISRAAASSV